MAVLLTFVIAWLPVAFADNGDGENGDTGQTEPPDSGEVVPPDTGDTAADTGDTVADTGDSAAIDADLDRFSLADGDCDDSNPAVYPGREETCDGFDNDCDDRVDESCPLNAELGGGCDCGSRSALVFLAPLALIRRRVFSVNHRPRTATS